MLIGPNTAQEYLSLTQTEQEVLAISSAAVVRWCFETYAELWDG